MPVLEKYGYPAVLFVPIGYLDDERPLPHDEHLASAASSTGRSTGRELAELEPAASGSSRTGSATARSPSSRSTRRRARSCSRSCGSRSALGRPVRAFAYVKGSEAHYRPVHLSLLRQAGYEVAFTSVSGSNGPRTSIRCGCTATTSSRIPARTFELVLAGACDLIAVKDTVAGHARAAAVQRRARHLDEVTSFEPVAVRAASSGTPSAG